MSRPLPARRPALSATRLAGAACASLLAAVATAGATTLPGRPQAPAAARVSESAPLACTDFDAYVNAEWNARTELPPDRARIGSFDVLRRDNDRLLEAALNDLLADPSRAATPGLQRLAAVYRSGMDSAAIERAGLTALAPLLARIDAATRAALPALLGELALLGVDQPLQPFVGTDLRDATRHLVNLSVGGLGLPDRDDYTRDEPASQRIRDGYRTYVQALAAASGAPATPEQVDALLRLEAALAAAQLSRVERRDPQRLDNRRTPAALADEAPGFDWSGWLSAWSGRAAPLPALNVAQPRVATAFAQQVQEAPLDSWRLYLRVRLLDTFAPALPAAFEQAHFAYRSGVLRGLRQPQPRAERVIAAVGGPNGSAPLGETLGELFVTRAFSPLAQRKALAMVEDIREAMRRRIASLPWMSAPTKQAALAKLDAMVTQIGAPPRWRDWQGLEIRPDDYAGNLLRAAVWASRERLAQLDRPVDRSRWTTSANTVNAFAAGGNRIVFPAGILQPPFFDASADDAANYGAIGSVIGHEITHHFDDRGRQFDAAGNLRDWWAPDDAAAYRARAAQVAALYSGFEPLPGVRIDGRQMLGENISDFGGIHIAYDGLQIALERQRTATGQGAPAVDGRTPSHRFFIADATMWRTKMREEALLSQLRTGQHSPGRWRILAPLAHQPAFARAFGCRAGDPMAAAEPIRIW